MALNKDAILKLRAEGFAAVEKSIARIGSGLSNATKQAAVLAAMAAKIPAGFTAAAGAANAAAAGMGAAAGATRATAAAASATAPALAKCTAEATRLAKVVAFITNRAEKFEQLNKEMKLLPGPNAQGAGPAGPANVVPSAVGAGLSGLGGALSKLMVPAAAVAGALYSVKRGGEALFAAIGRGEKVTQIATGFETLTAKVGGSAAVMTSLERATGGGVAKTDLMASANRLLVADLGLTRERMERLVAAGTTLGRALGFTATDSIERMSLALSKQEPELLDELGIKVDLTKAIQAYAQANQVTVESVNAQTRAQIFLGAVEEQAIARAGKLGAAVAVTATPVEAIAKRWADFTDRMATFVKDQPGFVKALTAIADAAMRITEAMAPLIELAGKVAAALAPVIEQAGKLAAAVAASPAALSALGAAAGGVGLPLAAMGAAQGVAQATGRGGAGGSGGGAARQGEVVELGPRTIAAIAQAMRGGRGESPLANAFGG